MNGIMLSILHLLFRVAIVFRCFQALAIGWERTSTLIDAFWQRDHDAYSAPGWVKFMRAVNESGLFFAARPGPGRFFSDSDPDRLWQPMC